MHLRQVVQDVASNEDILEETWEDWIESACGKWAHENCVDYDIVFDTSDRERMSLHCILYSI